MPCVAQRSSRRGRRFNVSGTATLADQISAVLTRRVLGVGKAALNRALRRQEIENVPFIQLPHEGEAFEHTATRDQLAAFLNVIPEDSHVLT